ITIPGDELQQAAAQFVHSSDNLAASMKELDAAISALERKWSGSTQQVFYRKYKDLHLAMEGMMGLMNNIALEMNTMADRMQHIDNRDNFSG
ncbi:MAG: WXG100 family type VII secretion target, partial [Chloroflexi bacterium]|nr:WXG100 family type VII secretion target [Chloroflexota bacterium]